jgi:glycosyltransferase involved in cell wall biosynthesis
MRSKKSLIVFSTWIQKSSSKQLQVYCRLKNQEGYEVYFVSDLHKVTTIRNQDGLILLGWPSLRPRGLKDLFFLWKLLHSVKPELVIANFTSFPFVILLSYCFRIKKRVAFFHTTLSMTSNQSKPKARTLIRLVLYRLCTHVIVVNQEIYQQVKERFKIPERKLFILLNSYDINASSKPEKKKEKIILTVATLELWKGVDILIQAFHMANKELQDYSLVIIGNGSLKQSLYELVESFSLLDRVHFLGEMRYVQVQEEMKKAEIFVLSSRNDGSPQVVLEAMANECLVIATAVGGIPAMVTDHVNGMLIPVDDVVERLSNALIKAARDSSVRKKLSTEARITVYTHFSSEAWALNLDSITSVVRN